MLPDIVHPGIRKLNRSVEFKLAKIKSLIEAFKLQS